MDRAIELMVSDEICELFPAMMKLDDADEEEEKKKVKKKKKLLGAKSSSIGKKKPKQLRRNLWGVNLSKEKKEEMKKIEDELQGGRDYIGVSRAPSVMVLGQKMKRFKAQFTDRSGRRIVVGTHYKSAKNAASAYDKAVLPIYGLQVRLNFPHRCFRINNTSSKEEEDTMVSTS